MVRVMDVLFDSMSAAHSAAPTAFVNEKKIPANGIISRRVATVPKLARHSESAEDLLCLERAQLGETYAV